MGLKEKFCLSECASDFGAFGNWITDALVAISPCADILVIASHSPEKMVYTIKSRTNESSNKCALTPMDIALDDDEQVTSLLCIPVCLSQQTTHDSPDWTTIVLGLSSGSVNFYTEQSKWLISLKFCDEPVANLRLQTRRSNSNARSPVHFGSITDELLILHKSCAITCDGHNLCENLCSGLERTVNGEPVFTPTNLPAVLNSQRWNFRNQCDTKVLDADLLGLRQSTKFDAMKSSSIDPEGIQTKSYSRSLLLVGSDPFISQYREAQDTTNHSYTKIIGSLLPFWRKPQPSKVLISDINCNIVSNLFDKNRRATSVIASPDKRLAAVIDDYDRIVLFDTTNCIITRIWKGYRNAQCGWIEVKQKSDERDTPRALFLVVYVPKRALLEVWSAQRGPRVAAFNVGKRCRLIYSGHKTLILRKDSQKSRTVDLPAEQSYSTNCYLLDANKSSIYSIEIPYTYSLHKYSDVQSRDQLLVRELVDFVDRDASNNVIIETLNRISTVESQEQAIHKLASLLTPDKLIATMEGLIGRIMTSYDDDSGLTISVDDQSIVELSRRLIRLSAIFNEQSELNNSSSGSYQNLDDRLVDECQDHPKEIEVLADHLGWTSTEVLRYLSLLALKRSCCKEDFDDLWPNMGEPLTWFEFVNCFDLSRRKILPNKKGQPEIDSHAGTSIKLKDLKHEFLAQENVLKTAVFLYNKSSESYYKRATESRDIFVDHPETNTQTAYSSLEPSSRLVLLFQFWLSTRLCDHWKMWAFLQKHIGQISDELKVIAMAQESDELLIAVWKRVYHIILESDNIYAAIIATAAIRGDTLRTLSDNEKRQKLKHNEVEKHEDSEEHKTASLDWECLCVDAERMSFLIQQLEDVFLLNLLLRYSLDDGHIVDRYVYRVPRISVASILRGGPTVVSELIAQWAAQSNVHPKIFTQPYGFVEEETDRIIMHSPSGRLLNFRSRIDSASSEESAKELLHHTKTSFPRSLEANVLLLNCLWEFCIRWTKTSSAADRHQYLNKALDCLSLLDAGPITNFKHNSAFLAYKTFFQKIFERLTILIETNPTILSTKSLKSLDTLSRRDLGMGRDCLEDFVQFCHHMSDLLLETFKNNTGLTNISEEEDRLRDQLLSLDDWWSTLSEIHVDDNTGRQLSDGSFMPVMKHISTGNVSGWPVVQPDSLLNIAISSEQLADVETLIELNRLTTLMLLVLKLKLTKIQPLSLIGEKSRQTLRLDSQQLPTNTNEMRKRPSQLRDLRRKFAKKSILSIVEKMTSETNDSDEALMDDPDIPDMENMTVSDDLERKQRSLGNQSTLNDMEATQSSGDQAVLLESNESMVLFTHLLTLASEWQVDHDELYMELVFEMYRCNHDKIAGQLSHRIRDKQRLADGLMKIATQRILILFGLSPVFSTELQWLQRVDKWPLFQPNVARWLKSIQESEAKHTIASLVFPDTLKPPKMIAIDRLHDEDDIDVSSDETTDLYIEYSLGLRTFVLHALKNRTKSILETVTNYLDGQANRLAYDLLQLLESKLFEKFVRQEKERWCDDPDRRQLMRT